MEALGARISGSFNTMMRDAVDGSSPLRPRRVCLAVSTMKETNFITLLACNDQTVTKEGAVLAYAAQKKGVLVMRYAAGFNCVVIWSPPWNVDSGAVDAKVQAVLSSLKNYSDSSELQLCALHLHDGEGQKEPWTVPQHVGGITCHRDIVAFAQMQDDFFSVVSTVSKCEEARWMTSATGVPLGAVYKNEIAVSKEAESWGAFRTFLRNAAGTCGSAGLDSGYMAVMFTDSEQTDKAWWEEHLRRWVFNAPSVLWTQLLEITGQLGSIHYIVRGEPALLDAIAVSTVLAVEVGAVRIAHSSKEEFDEVAWLSGKCVHRDGGKWEYDDCVVPAISTAVKMEEMDLQFFDSVSPEEQLAVLALSAEGAAPQPLAKRPKGRKANWVGDAAAEAHRVVPLVERRTRRIKEEEDAVIASGSGSEAEERTDGRRGQTEIDCEYLLNGMLSWWRAHLQKIGRGGTTSKSNKWEEIVTHIRGLVGVETDPAQKALGERLLKGWERTQKGPREMFENAKRKASKHKHLIYNFEERRMRMMEEEGVSQKQKRSAAKKRPQVDDDGDSDIDIVGKMVAKLSRPE